jgi:hypothetical protein
LRATPTVGQTTRYGAAVGDGKEGTDDPGAAAAESATIAEAARPAGNGADIGDDKPTAGDAGPAAAALERFP